MTRHPAVTPAERSLAAAGILVPAAIGVTTVGALWLVPATLLTASLLVVAREWSRDYRDALAAHGSH